MNGTVSLPIALLIIAAIIGVGLLSTAIGVRLWERRGR